MICNKRPPTVAAHLEEATDCLDYVIDDGLGEFGFDALKEDADEWDCLGDAIDAAKDAHKDYVRHVEELKGHLKEAKKAVQAAWDLNDKLQQRLTDDTHRCATCNRVLDYPEQFLGCIACAPRR